MTSRSKWMSLLAVPLMALMALLFVAQAAEAQFTLADPNGVLLDLQTYSNAPKTNFEAAMGCGKSKTFTASHSRCLFRCTSMFCSSQCEVASGFEAKFDISVAECTADSVHLFGDNGLKLEISRLDFERDGTWLPALLKGLGFWIQPVGELNLVNHWRASVSRIVGGKKVPISNARQLQFELRYPNSTQFNSFIVLLDMDKSGLDQFVGLVEGLLLDSSRTIFALERGVIIDRSTVGRPFP